MVRISQGLVPGVALGLALSVALPPVAQADWIGPPLMIYRHHSGPYAYRYGRVGAILNHIARSPYYKTYGQHEDSYAASHYPGPIERHYFGYGQPCFCY